MSPRKVLSEKGHEPRLLGRSSNTCVANNADSEACSQTSQSDRETSTELNEAGVQGHRGAQISRNQDADDQSV
jgi:hypothetical protein